MLECRLVTSLLSEGVTNVLKETLYRLRVSNLFIVGRQWKPLIWCCGRNHAVGQVGDCGSWNGGLDHSDCLYVNRPVVASGGGEWRCRNHQEGRVLSEKRSGGVGLADHGCHLEKSLRGRFAHILVRASPIFSAEIRTRKSAQSTLTDFRWGRLLGSDFRCPATFGASRFSSDGSCSSIASTASSIPFMLPECCTRRRT